jgi:hypothetical protein
MSEDNTDYLACPLGILRALMMILPFWLIVCSILAALILI